MAATNMESLPDLSAFMRTTAIRQEQKQVPLPEGTIEKIAELKSMDITLQELTSVRMLLSMQEKIGKSAHSFLDCLIAYNDIFKNKDNLKSAIIIEALSTLRANAIDAKGRLDITKIEKVLKSYTLSEVVQAIQSRGGDDKMLLYGPALIVILIKALPVSVEYSYPVNVVERVSSALELTFHYPGNVSVIVGYMDGIPFVKRMNGVFAGGLWDSQMVTEGHKAGVIANLILCTYNRTEEGALIYNEKNMFFIKNTVGAKLLHRDSKFTSLSLKTRIESAKMNYNQLHDSLVREIMEMTVQARGDLYNLVTEEKTQWKSSSVFRPLQEVMRKCYDKYFSEVLKDNLEQKGVKRAVLDSVVVETQLMKDNILGSCLELSKFLVSNLDNLVDPDTQKKVSLSMSLFVDNPYADGRSEGEVAIEYLSSDKFGALLSKTREMRAQMPLLKDHMGKMIDPDKEYSAPGVLSYCPSISTAMKFITAVDNLHMAPNPIIYVYGVGIYDHFKCAFPKGATLRKFDPIPTAGIVQGTVQEWKEHIDFSIERPIYVVSDAWGGSLTHMGPIVKAYLEMSAEPRIRGLVFKFLPYKYQDIRKLMPGVSAEEKLETPLKGWFDFFSRITMQFGNCERDKYENENPKPKEGGLDLDTWNSKLPKMNRGGLGYFFTGRPHNGEVIFALSREEGHHLLPLPVAQSLTSAMFVMSLLRSSVATLARNFIRNYGFSNLGEFLEDELSLVEIQRLPLFFSSWTKSVITTFASDSSIKIAKAIISKEGVVDPATAGYLGARNLFDLVDNISDLNTNQLYLLEGLLSKYNDDYKHDSSLSLVGQKTLAIVHDYQKQRAY